MSIREQSHWKVNERTAAEYLEVCRLAATDDRMFATFKSDRRYQEVLEHCSKSVALEYYKQIDRDNPELLTNGKLFDNDRYGSPEIRTFGNIRCSTSTLQYIGVLSNLMKLFGSLDGMRIVEIGGGYGGQAKVIMDMFKVAVYEIIDLAEPGMLQERYLKGYPVETYRPRPVAEQYDLLISNYALSEIMEPMQTMYVNTFFPRCKHGYITCNSVIDSIHYNDTMKVLPDIPGEREENFIITW